MSCSSTNQTRFFVDYFRHIILAVMWRTSVRMNYRMLIALALCFLSTAAMSTDQRPTPASKAAPRLLTIPTQIYSTVVKAKEGNAGWVFFLILETADEGVITPSELTLTYLSKGKPVRTETLSATALLAVDKTNYPPARLTGTVPTQPTFWPHAFRIHASVPAALGVDALEAKLSIAARNKKPKVVQTTIPIRTYGQKTSLIFPFLGKGIVSQGGAFEVGHRNRSGLYAIDAIGLTDTYAPVIQGNDAIQDYAGWGRTIIAPAAGKVVQARNDRPDQPVDGVSDPTLFAPEYPDGGDTGNSVVIDHGNGEFSLLAHLQKGSVRVRVGDEVTQGQPIALLGNSGDTTGPHVHYQLQDGPQWEFANALPAQFGNVRQTSKGSYFEAK